LGGEPKEDTMKTLTLTVSVSCPENVDPVQVLSDFIEAGVEQARARVEINREFVEDDEVAAAAVSCTWGNVEVR
jgi:hypothetical protein